MMQQAAGFRPAIKPVACKDCGDLGGVNALGECWLCEETAVYNLLEQTAINLGPEAEAKWFDQPIETTIREIEFTKWVRLRLNTSKEAA